MAFLADNVTLKRLTFMRRVLDIDDLVSPTNRRAAMAGTVCVFIAVLLFPLWVTITRGLSFTRTEIAERILVKEFKTVTETHCTIDYLLEEGIRRSVQEQYVNHTSGNAELIPDADLITTELDMKLTYEQFSTLYRATGNQRNKRKTIQPWPSATMPYVLDPLEFTGGVDDVVVLHMAMRDWEHYTCFNFKAYDERVHKHYVKITGGIGCNSMVGFGKRKPQYIQLSRMGCRYFGVYLHVLGHAIGLPHQHQRPDRDKFVQIKKENVEQGFLHAFTKYEERVVDTSAPYDFTSIMHFGKYAYGKKRGKDTILQTMFVIDPRNEGLMGNIVNKSLSFYDVRAVNVLYKCNRHCTNLPLCKDGGFVDKTCQCLCPDGSRNCQVDGLTNKPKDCKNKHPKEDECEQWAKEHQCTLNPMFTLSRCMKSCKKCGIDYRGDSGRAKGSCKNLLGDENCRYLAYAWYCDANPAFMLYKCRQACGWCERIYETQCQDLWMNKTECAYWASIGYCRKSKVWMLANCRSSCGWCELSRGCSNDHKNDLECFAWSAVGECEKSPKYMYANCKRACGKCGVVKFFDCRTFYDDKDCKERARKSQCASADDTAISCRKHCQKALCPFNECRDTEARCEFWARHGECHLNPKYMMTYCSYSCKQYMCPDSPSDWVEEIHCSNMAGSVMEKRCVGLAVIGFCHKNPFGMLKYCYRSCTQCDGEDVECKDTAGDCDIRTLGTNCQDAEGVSIHGCRKTCGFCSASKLKEVVQCLDMDNDCHQRRLLKQCETHAEIMEVRCMKTCNRCDTVACYDVYDASVCKKIKRDGECDRPHPRRPLLAQTYCAKTCGLCGGKTPVYPVYHLTPQPNKCVNNLPLEGGSPELVDNKCRLYVANDFCKTREDEMKKWCFKACFCEYACADLHRDCQKLAQNGACYSSDQKKVDFMTRYCPKSCKICKGNTEQTTKATEKPRITYGSTPSTADRPRATKACCDSYVQRCKVLGNVSCRFSTDMQIRCPQTCGFCKPVCKDKSDRCTKLKDKCTDYHSTESMRYHCAATCNFCKVCRT